MILKFQQIAPAANLTVNDIDLFITKGALNETQQFLSNKDTLYDLVYRGLWKESKLTPNSHNDLYSYWNGGNFDDRAHEIIWVKVRRNTF